MSLRPDLTATYENTNTLQRVNKSNELLKSLPKEQYDANLQLAEQNVKTLASVLNECQEEQKAITAKSNSLLCTFQTQVNNQSKMITDSLNTCKAQEKGIVELKSSTSMYGLLSVMQIKELKEKDMQIIALQQKLKDSEHKLESLLLSKKYEGNAVLQLQQLKSENESLIKILSKTKKNELLAVDLAPNACSIKPKLSYPTKRKSDIERENDWIPQAVHNLCTRFMVKNKIKEEEMNALINEMRKLWAKRELEVIQHVNAKYNYEVKYLSIQVERAKSCKDVKQYVLKSANEI